MRRRHSRLRIPDLVRGLSGAAGDMHDYLAEEVLDHLDATFADFLVRASCSRTSTLMPRPPSPRPPRARSSADRDVGRPGPGSRRDAATDYRFVPLVREFLRARLSAVSSDAEIQQMHLQLAKQFEGTNWRISATHYQRGGDPRKASDVVCGSLDRILGEGQYKAADDLLAGDQGDVIVRGILRFQTLAAIRCDRRRRPRIDRHSGGSRGIHHEFRALAAQNAASIAYGARTFDLVAELLNAPSTSVTTLFSARCPLPRVDPECLLEWQLASDRPPVRTTACESNQARPVALRGDHESEPRAVPCVARPTRGGHSPGRPRPSVAEAVIARL